MKKFYLSLLPCILTSGNLLSGFLAILLVLERNFTVAAWYILLGMVFDIMDGRVARWVKGTSGFGAEYDSLADVVTFGLAPAVLFYFCYLGPLGVLGPLVAFSFVLCGALRLARFNVMPSTPHFLGLPIPGGAGLLATLYLFADNWQIDLSGGFAAAMTLIAAFLMVSTIPYPAVKKSVARKSRSIFFAKTSIMLVILGAIWSWPENILFGLAVLYALSGPVYGMSLVLAKIEARRAAREESDEPHRKQGR